MSVRGKLSGANRIVSIFAMCTIFFGAMPQQAALAIEAGETNFLPSVPLMITAYQTSNLGKDLRYLELYNSGDTLLSIQDFSIVDPDNAERKLQLSTVFSGALLTGGHVVASRTAGVSNASFVIDGWNSSPAAPVAIKKLRIDAAGYRSVEAGLSTKDAERDVSMARTYNTSSYSTAASPFVVNYRTAPQSLLFDDGLYSAPETPNIEVAEIYPYASDCSPFDASVLCGDYVKLYNPTATSILLEGLVLRTDSSSSSRTTSNTITLSEEIAPGGYYLVWQTDTGSRLSLTNSGGYIWLEDSYGLVRYESTLAHYESAGSSLQGYAYARDGNGDWQWTSTPMPESVNVITAPAAAACEEGKYRNPETGRCRTLEETINALAACEEGYERSPTTNRCRKIASNETVLTPCREGQVRSPETNRCRSIASEVVDLLPCAEGYERNPATNRCRKVQSGEVLSAAYPVEPYDQAATGSATLWVVGGIAALALSYGIWEWRREIGAGFTKFRTLVTSGRD